MIVKSNFLLIIFLWILGFELGGLHCNTSDNEAALLMFRASKHTVDDRSLTFVQNTLLGEIWHFPLI